MSGWITTVRPGTWLLSCRQTSCAGESAASTETSIGQVSSSGAAPRGMQP